jgi:hypothetical protein
MHTLNSNTHPDVYWAGERERLAGERERLGGGERETGGGERETEPLKSLVSAGAPVAPGEWSPANRMPELARTILGIGAGREGGNQ